MKNHGVITLGLAIALICNQAQAAEAAKAEAQHGVLVRTRALAEVMAARSPDADAKKQRDLATAADREATQLREAVVRARREAKQQNSQLVQRQQQAAAQHPTAGADPLFRFSARPKHVPGTVLQPRGGTVGAPAKRALAAGKGGSLKPGVGNKPAAKKPAKPLVATPRPPEAQPRQPQAASSNGGPAVGSGSDSSNEGPRTYGLRKHVEEIVIEADEDEQ